MDNQNLSPADLWKRVFDQVQRTINAPMVWLAMQSARPITVDGSYFVVGLPADKQYMANNLKTFENVTAIEDALRDVSGRILALRLIEGETLADWQAVLLREAPPLEFESGPSAAPAPTTGGGSFTLPPETPREVVPSWEKLGERLQQLYKAAPHVRYPHGQARFVLEAVKYISDTMDLLMPGPGQPPDDLQERSLSKVMERLSSTVNLDAMFLALELFRYRASRGK